METRYDTEIQWGKRESGTPGDHRTPCHELPATAQSAEKEGNEKSCTKGATDLPKRGKMEQT